MDIKDIFKDKLADRNLKQVSRATGVPYYEVYKAANGKSISIEHGLALINYLEIKQ